MWGARRRRCAAGKARRRISNGPLMAQKMVPHAAPRLGQMRFQKVEPGHARLAEKCCKTNTNSSAKMLTPILGTR